MSGVTSFSTGCEIVTRGVAKGTSGPMAPRVGMLYWANGPDSSVRGPSKLRKIPALSGALWAWGIGKGQLSGGVAGGGGGGAGNEMGSKLNDGSGGAASGANAGTTGPGDAGRASAAGGTERAGADRGAGATISDGAAARYTMSNQASTTPTRYLRVVTGSTRRAATRPSRWPKRGMRLTS